MNSLLERFATADHLTKMELAGEANALPPEELASAVSALESVEHQQTIVSALVDKWLEDQGGVVSSPWETATPTLLALRAALLERWEAADRAELGSMQIFRMSYLYSVGHLASFARDAHFDQVRSVIEEQLLESDVADDARAILSTWLGTGGA